jgi:hypothetical protein
LEEGARSEVVARAVAAAQASVGTGRTRLLWEERRCGERGGGQFRSTVGDRERGRKRRSKPLQRPFSLFSFASVCNKSEESAREIPPKQKKLTGRAPPRKQRARKKKQRRTSE